MVNNSHRLEVAVRFLKSDLQNHWVHRHTRFGSLLILATSIKRAVSLSCLLVIACLVEISRPPVECDRVAPVIILAARFGTSLTLWKVVLAAIPQVPCIHCIHPILSGLARAVSQLHTDASESTKAALKMYLFVAVNAGTVQGYNILLLQCSYLL